LLGADGGAEAAAERLAGKGLWFNRLGTISTPKWCFDRLEHHLLVLDDNWHVWTQWYRPLLQGQSGWGLSAKKAENLIVRITTQDEDFWDAGASEANAEIATWLEELKVREDVERKIQDDNIPASTVRAQAEFLLRISPATALAAETVAAQLAAILDKFLNETQQNILPEELQMFDNIRQTYETFQKASSPDEQDAPTQERITKLETAIKELHQQISALNEELAAVNSKGESLTSKALETFVLSAAKAAGVAVVAGVGLFLANVYPQAVTELAQQVANLKPVAGNAITTPTP